MELIVVKALAYGASVLTIITVLKNMIPSLNGWRTLIPTVALSAGFTWFDVTRGVPPYDYGAGIMLFIQILAAAIGANLTVAKATTGEFPSMKVTKKDGTP